MSLNTLKTLLVSSFLLLLTACGTHTVCQQPEAPTVAIEEIERQVEREEWDLSPDLLQSCAMPTMDAQSLEDVIKQTQGNLEYFRLVCGRLNLLIDKVEKSRP